MDSELKISKCTICQQLLTTHGKHRAVIYKCGHWSCECCALKTRKCYIKNCETNFRNDQLIFPIFENPVKENLTSDKERRLKNQLTNLEKLKQELTDKKKALKKILREKIGK
jgi:hypothetical protein